jgi:hypothetical protein
MESGEPRLPAVRCIAWLGLKLDGSEDGVVNVTIRYLLLKVDYDVPLHASLALHGFCPGDDGLLLIRVEYVPNDNVRLTTVVSRPCGIDGGIMRFDLVYDDMTFVHRVGFIVLLVCDPSGEGEVASKAHDNNRCEYPNEPFNRALH